MCSSRRMSSACRSFWFVPLLTAALVAATAAPAIAQGTHLWTQSTLEDFEKGTPQGVAITSDGHLHQGPGLTARHHAFDLRLVRRGGQKWRGLSGTSRRQRSCGYKECGTPFTLFKTKDLTVQVVRLGPDGSLYAATLPSGKVYKLDPAATTKDETNATVVFDRSKLPPAERRE